MKISRKDLRTTAAGAVLAALVGCVAVTASPANAFSQYCGPDQSGIHLGGYAPGSRQNAHPDPEASSRGWAGGAAVGDAKNVALAINRVAAFIGMSESIWDSKPFAEPSKEVKFGYSIAKLAADIAQIAAEAAVLGLEQRNAEMNACAAVFAGDTVDLLFVARMQEELAGLDPANGPITVPSSVFLLPDDGNPNLTQYSQHYQGRNGHEQLGIPYVDGFANNEYIGVAVMVRNTIAHLEAHGINTGGGTVWVPGVGLQHQDGAKDLWWDGIFLLRDGRVRLAYAKFSEAYRMAVTVHTTS